MGTESNFDVSLDYNTLVTEIEAIVDINNKCYELFSSICEALEATGF